MTHIHSVRLTGEAAETHAWSAGVLCGCVWDASRVPNGNTPVLRTSLSLCVSKSVLDPVDILPPFLGMRKRSDVAEPQVVPGFAKLFVSG